MKRLRIIAFVLIVFSFVRPVFCGEIKGEVILSEEWEPYIFLSQIRSFQDLNLISNDIIIDATSIDSQGHFYFDITYLPQDEAIYRLHIIKKGDSQASLIIGGHEENYVHIILDRDAFLNITGKVDDTTSFSLLEIQRSPPNLVMRQIDALRRYQDSLVSDESYGKRKFLQHSLVTNYLEIADTTSHYLAGLYALHLAKYFDDSELVEKSLKRFAKKWNPMHSAYFDDLKEQTYPKSSWTKWMLLVLGIGLGIVLSRLWQQRSFVKNGFLDVKTAMDELSVQERNIFDLLRAGKTNKEIAAECHISVSTVKTHVSSIYSKLKVNSRKEIMNLKV